MTHRWLHEHKKLGPPDPKCPNCKGKGFSYFRGVAKMCKCRLTIRPATSA
jgi:hypothetical protein